MNLSQYLSERRSLVEKALDSHVPSVNKPPARLNAAIRHSLMAGGKRLRPILVLAACEAVEGPVANLLPFACALECIHTYSLIHDDLPAMDDDDLRRGRPTCHKAFDEATAILAGDALLTLAFELAASPMKDIDPGDQLTMIAQLARDAGIFGMVGGQMLDIEAENREVTLVELQNVHIHKTGALIRAACLAGGKLGGGDREQVKRLKRYGEAIGLAFQVMDDILDEVGDSAVMGKSAGSDRARSKATYPHLLGLPQAREEAQFLVDEALSQLQPFSAAADPLRELARFIVSRTH
ncbi:MAG: polyprenyl synthetase family protein [Magnetococcales bacterium]|nr:polyprenyl synthetase family protein [Magnetococcales bacterium]